MELTRDLHSGDLVSGSRIGVAVQEGIRDGVVDARNTSLRAPWFPSRSVEEITKVIRHRSRLREIKITNGINPPFCHDEIARMIVTVDCLDAGFAGLAKQFCEFRDDMVEGALRCIVASGEVAHAIREKTRVAGVRETTALHQVVSV